MSIEHSECDREIRSAAAPNEHLPPSRETSDRPSGSKLHISEADAKIVITTPLPETRPDEVIVEVIGRTLTIRRLRSAQLSDRGRRDDDDAQQTLTRSVKLPDTVDTGKVISKLADGVLTITIPKRVPTLTRYRAGRSLFSADKYCAD
ncbi:MAG: Hsp20/alpha crystallin family protein [Chloroflexales bacterium]|nr:Hsp20/alpha crystallin family protein [Chloroflexales bacterium]